MRRFILIGCLIIGHSFAQSYQQTFTGPTISQAWGVIPVDNSSSLFYGNSAIIGFTGQDIFLLKVDMNGDTIWSQLYGGAGFETALSATKTSDGGFIIAGYTYSFGAGNSDGCIIKTDSVGNLQWSRIFGGIYAEDLVAGMEDPDGNFIFVGSSASFGGGATDFDIYLVKTDATGDTIFTRRYGETGADNGLAMQLTSDSCYIITGYTNSFSTGLDDILLMKIDRSGNILWDKIYGGTEGDAINSIIETSDGGFLLGGKSHSFGAPVDGDLYLLKLDVNGDTIWSKTYGGNGSEWAYEVVETPSGYTAAGWTYSFDDAIHGYLLHTDPNGNLQWSKMYGDTLFDYLYGMYNTIDGGYILAGTTGGVGGADGGYMIKTDDLGYSGCYETSPATNSLVVHTQVADSNFFNASTQSIVTIPIMVNLHGCLMYEICNNTGLEEIVMEELDIFPNPTTGILNIPLDGKSHVTIHDISGRILFEQNLDKDEQLSLGRLADGLYLLRINSDGRYYTARMILKK